MTITKKLLLTMAITAMPIVAMTNISQAEVDVNKAAPSVEIKTTTYSYDLDNDGIIEPNEFTTYVTRTYDVNNDGYIVVDEYDPFTYYVYSEKEREEAKSYSYWDKDKDNRLDSSEVETLVANTGFYKKWDYDDNGTIEMDEFAKGTFMAYDDDGDQMISMEEWKDVLR